jgi:hypothetical protein
MVIMWLPLVAALPANDGCARILNNGKLTNSTILWLFLLAGGAFSINNFVQVANGSTSQQAQTGVQRGSQSL